MQPVVIYQKKSKLRLMAAGSLLFVLGGLWIGLGLTGSGIERYVLAAIAVSSILFFGLCFVYVLVRLIRPTPVVVIDAEGIIDNGSMVSAGRLRWSEISRVGIYSYQGQEIIGIEPVDLETVLRRHSPVFRAMIRLNQLLVPTPFNIPVSVLPMSADELVEIMIEHWRESGAYPDQEGWQEMSSEDDEFTEDEIQIDE